MFRKTSYSRVFQDLVEQIQTAILQGKLQPGDKLPSQREMIEMFQTSRASLREALRVLEQKGLIEVKLGAAGGAVVKNVDTGPITEGLALMMQQQQISIGHLTEFREAVEGIVAALAARRATPSDIKRLHVLLDEAQGFLAGPAPDAGRSTRVDMQVHIALAEIAGNPIFTAVLRMVHEHILGSVARFVVTEGKRLQENQRDLVAIVQAVESGAAATAETRARDHVRRFTRYLRDSEARWQKSVGPESDRNR
jgi:DNA-binding FadR family transcriptional regulator